jgi:hypothetical protein
MNQHLVRGTKIQTVYGSATITRKPDEDGVMGIRYEAGDYWTLDTNSEQFTVTEPAE